MKALVEEKEIEQVKACLETTPLLKGELGKNWIANNLLNAEKRETKHFLFWIFLEDWKIQKMEKWLKDLKTCIPESKYKKIINRLKEKRTEKDFKSLISEIEVLSYYSNLGIKVDYEPRIPDKSNVGDIKLTINSNEIFLEVTRLFASIAEEARDSLVHSVVDAIEAIQENPFIISVDIEDGFSTYDVEPCLKLVCEEIEKNRHKLEPTEDTPYVITYGSVYCPKATFTFLKKITKKKGYVGGSLLPFVKLNDAGRLKNKILGELRQLPDNRFNVSY